MHGTFSICHHVEGDIAAPGKAHPPQSTLIGIKNDTAWNAGFYVPYCMVSK
jgi:hypothetical protein